MTKHRLYLYVGLPELLKVSDAIAGTSIISQADLDQWIVANADTSPELTATFIVDAGGALRLADRRSEHVHCAGGGPVLSAGEMVFSVTNGSVMAVTNQSTGFCPEPSSWSAVAAALDQIGVAHPGGFTSEFVFRLCPACGERNIVRENWFVCAVCECDLPRDWNFDT